MAARVPWMGSAGSEKDWGGPAATQVGLGTRALAVKSDQASTERETSPCKGLQGDAVS